MSDEAFRVEPLIRRYLDEHPEAVDPMIVTRAIVDAIPEDKLRSALLRCAYDRTRKVFREHRHDLAFDGDGDDDELGSRRQKKAGVSRWKRHGRWPVAGGDWKLLEDLTPEDCEWNAAEYDRRAAANQEMADRFRVLAERLRSSRVKRVGDLPDFDAEQELPEAA